MKRDVVEKCEGKLWKYKQSAEELSKMLIKEKKELKRL